MLIKLSAEQRPLFTQTASGGKIMAMRPRRMSLPHMLKVESGQWCVLRVCFRSRTKKLEKKLRVGGE